MKIVGALLPFLLLLCSCATTQGVAVKADPIPENCEATCRTPCTTSGIQYIHDPAVVDAFDRLVETVVIPLKGRVEQCDTHRQACVQCLDRIKDAGLTK